MSEPVVVPERVRHKAMAVGPAGERWLDDIGQIVIDLALEWDIRVGATSHTSSCDRPIRSRSGSRGASG